MKHLIEDVYEVSDDEYDGIQTEVERYMAEPQKGENPLGWWIANAHHFPHMQKLAKRFFADQVPAFHLKGLFSAGGHMVTEDRARLDPDNVDEFLVLHSYYKEKGSAYKQEVMQIEKKGTASEAATLPLPTLKYEN